MSASLEDTLNDPEPPERIHASEVDLFGETHGSFQGPRMPGGWGIVYFDWQRPDGTTLHYVRWVDEDGHWFYSRAEATRRALENT